MRSAGDLDYEGVNFSDIYIKNRRFNMFLMGGLGTLTCCLIYFKLLLVDFVTYQSPLIDPVLFFISAVSTCVCLNGWLLSAGGKLLFSLLSLAYPLFPLLCRAMAPELIQNEVVVLDEFLAEGLSWTLVALLSTVTYSIAFQSYQLYFARMLVLKPELITNWLNSEVIPFEKKQSDNLTSINRSVRLKQFLASSSGRKSRLALILFKDKLKTTKNLQVQRLTDEPE